MFGSTSSIVFTIILLLCQGCYSFRYLSVEETQESDQIIVATAGGAYYRFLEWKSDDRGNITGSAQLYQTREAAREGGSGSSVNASLTQDEILTIEAKRRHGFSWLLIIHAIALPMVMFILL